MPVGLLVAGLGNPGARYEGTRHNVGFMVIDQLAADHGFTPFRAKSNALVAQGQVAGHEVLAVKPQTYMNLSGDAVAPLAKFHRLPSSSVVIVHDELDFDPGIVRLKISGGAGGHNGLKSLIAHLGPDFVRIRVGIGKPPVGRGADYVLSRFAAEERALIDDAVGRAVDAIELISTQGLSVALNRTNAHGPIRR